ncbi:MAG: hypothetical protein ABFS37_07620 [Acidobacteriota bacterium]
MKGKWFLGALVLVVGAAIGTPLTVSAAGPSDLAGEMTQFDVALEIFKAVDVNHGSATAAQAMAALQSRGVVLQTWDGLNTVTMAEVGRIMHQMGIEVELSNPGDVVDATDLEQLLKTYRTEIGMVSSDWSDGEEFLPSVVLGIGDRRIISSSEF